MVKQKDRTDNKMGTHRQSGAISRAGEMPARANKNMPTMTTTRNQQTFVLSYQGMRDFLKKGWFFHLAVMGTIKLYIDFLC